MIEIKVKYSDGYKSYFIAADSIRKVSKYKADGSDEWYLEVFYKGIGTKDNFLIGSESEVDEYLKRISIANSI